MFCSNYIVKDILPLLMIMMNSENKYVLLKFFLVLFCKIFFNLLLIGFLIEVLNSRIFIKSKLCALSLIIRKHKNNYRLNFYHKVNDIDFHPKHNKHDCRYHLPILFCSLKL